MSTTTYSDYDYKVGTLVIDVYDAAEKNLIWEAVGSGTINENPKGRDKRIPVTVAAIMKKYPIASAE